ncbi:MAG: LPS export ABC transporter permease LptF [Desulfococcaceae bacterium]
MKFNSIINRYVFRELFTPFSLNLLFFTFVFLLAEILKITNMIVNYRIGLLTVIRMMAFTVPYFLVFVIPMSVMMAVLLTFLRMSGDNEIIALKAGGVSVYQVLPAVVSFCLLGTLLTGVMIGYGMPLGRSAFRRLTMDVARSHIDLGLKERTFTDAFTGVMLYVNEIDPRKRELIDVFIRDERNPDRAATVVAPRGRLFSDPENFRFQLRLFDGQINQVNMDKATVNNATFETYDIRLDLREAAAAVGTGPKHEKEMRPGELREFLNTAGEKDDRYYRILVEFHRKFALPFACLALGILAVPLGAQSRSAKTAFGLGLGLFLFLFYYLMLSAGLVFGEQGSYPPAVGMWVPNLVTAGLGLFLLDRTVHGRTIYIDRFLRMFSWFRR